MAKTKKTKAGKKKINGLTADETRAEIIRLREQDQTQSAHYRHLVVHAKSVGVYSG